jgi:hypothetical protein
VLCVAASLVLFFLCFISAQCGGICCPGNIAKHASRSARQ